MCSDRANTHVLSHLVRAADIGRNTRFVNEQKWGAGRNGPTPTAAVTSLVAAHESLVDWRLATDRTPGPFAEGARTQDDLRRACPDN